MSGWETCDARNPGLDALEMYSIFDKLTRILMEDDSVHSWLLGFRPRVNVFSQAILITFMCQR